MMAEPREVTREEAAVIAWAALVGLEIPAPCLPGVAANLDLLRDHYRRLQAADPEATP